MNAQHQQSLVDFLSSSTVDVQEIKGALEEFIFRSILDNRRIRAWCAIIAQVLEQVRIERWAH